MTIGFIGLGIMGGPMAKNLLKAGHKLVVYDLAPGPVGELVAAGAERGASPADVASKTDTIITVLPNSPHVKEAVLGRNGIVEGAKKGSLLIDMSSIDPVASKDVAAELAKRGLGMLDAPVSGGEAKAVDGSLSIMVGGSEAGLRSPASARSAAATRSSWSTR
jgi:2-hydroxy-3-oxopropionate reductase